ncbi:MAG: hypothetical protein DHS20C13_22140 [Thermodesulfobacteriota bacterium]|nr:MAG: hypothetical protein DHS20C13_22140 [Thermodesulfobacteriota bacterium]GJM35911.1 MAG: hypothetical protein DHS20C18_49120 [Saprospiraceae bacterium]
MKNLYTALGITLILTGFSITSSFSQKDALSIRSGKSNFRVTNGTKFSYTYLLEEDGIVIQKFTIPAEATRTIDLAITKNNINRYKIRAIYDNEALSMDKERVERALREAEFRARMRPYWKGLFVVLDGYFTKGRIHDVIRTYETIEIIATSDDLEEILLRSADKWGFRVLMLLDDKTSPLVKPLIAGAYATVRSIESSHALEEKEKQDIMDYIKTCLYKYAYEEQYGYYNLVKFIDLYPRYKLSASFSTPFIFKPIEFNGRNYSNSRVPTESYSGISASHKAYSFELYNQLHYKNKVSKKGYRFGYDLCLSYNQSPIIYRPTFDENFPLNQGYSYRSFGLELGKTYRALGANRPTGLNISFLAGPGVNLRSIATYDTPIPTDASNISYTNYEFDAYTLRARAVANIDLNHTSIMYSLRAEFGALNSNGKALRDGYFSYYSHNIALTFPIYKKMKPAPDY